MHALWGYYRMVVGYGVYHENAQCMGTLLDQTCHIQVLVTGHVNVIFLIENWYPKICGHVLELPT